MSIEAQNEMWDAIAQQETASDLRRMRDNWDAIISGAQPPSTNRSAYRRITARYRNGACATCGQKIQKGDDIYYTTLCSRAAIIHAGCWT